MIENGIIGIKRTLVNQEIVIVPVQIEVPIIPANFPETQPSSGFTVNFAGGCGRKGDKSGKKNDTPKQGEWPIRYPYEIAKELYGHAESALKHIDRLESLGYDVTEARKEWAMKLGEIYSSGPPKDNKQ